MPRTPAVVPATLLLALLAGCGGDDGDEGGSSGPTSPSGSVSESTSDPATPTKTEDAPEEPTQTEDAPAPPAGAPEVEVLDEGNEPRVPFTLDLEVGDVQTSVLTVDQDIDAGQPLDVPAIEVTVSNEVVSVDDTVELRTTYDDVRVVDRGAPGAAEIEQAVSSIEGVSGTTVLSLQGATLSTELDVPDGADPTVRQTLEQFQGQASALTVPFPEADLGAGASWRATSEPTLAGITLRQTTTYEVTSLEGDRYEIAVSVDQEVLPGSVPGAEVVGGTGTTEGTASGTAGALLPDRSESSGTNTVVVESGGQRQEVSTTTTTTVETTDG